jgi:hypothetical protein
MGLALTLSPGRHWLSPLLVFFGSRTSTRIAANDAPASHPVVVLGSTLGDTQPARSRVSHQCTTPQRLRVVSVSDAASRPGLAGRMVISGRFADVCAELERLEALDRRQPRSN